ncbi:MAG: hypothetical protein ACI845_004161 [Gammaproteobacteria bacterium]|jgi:hypothetical protein
MQSAAIEQETPNGKRRYIDGTEYIFYDGYWIRYYPPLEDTLSNRKRLIDSLTRRAFHHTEAGINTPGRSLDQARAAYEKETNPHRKRVNAAMLAGSLFNRATDLFTSIVDLAELGVKVSRDNALMRECSACFVEALSLGQQVKHHSGCEGIDEIWGEPFKAFTIPIDQFYESRFLKIAQSMRDIDLISKFMVENFCRTEPFVDLAPLIEEYAIAAKKIGETMKKDDEIFVVWPDFVALGEEIKEFKPVKNLTQEFHNIQALIDEGRQLIRYIAGARVPMPLSSQVYFDKCHTITGKKVKPDNLVPK